MAETAKMPRTFKHSTTASSPQAQPMTSSPCNPQTTTTFQLNFIKGAIRPIKALSHNSIKLSKKVKRIQRDRAAGVAYSQHAVAGGNRPAGRVFSQPVGAGPGIRQQHIGGHAPRYPEQHVANRPRRGRQVEIQRGTDPDCGNREGGTPHDLVGHKALAADFNLDAGERECLPLEVRKRRAHGEQPRGEFVKDGNDAGAAYSGRHVETHHPAAPPGGGTGGVAAHGDYHASESVVCEFAEYHIADVTSGLRGRVC